MASPLARRRKRAAALAEQPPVIHPADRLSRLPDEILAQILSFLPAQEAVRTVPEVREFVDRLLRLRRNGLESAPLDECDIMFHMCDDHGTRSAVHSWIQCSLVCQVQALRIINENKKHYLLMLEWPLISRHLTRLELSGVWLGCVDLNVDGCPALEHLKVRSCCLFGVRKIMSPSLKRLVITKCDSLEGLRISAPCLASLWLEVGAFRSPVLESMPKLFQAYVRNVEDYPRLNAEGFMLLEGLAQAKHLVLLACNSMTVRYIFRRDLRLCPTFSNLKTLVLNGYWCEPADCRSLACILEHAPVLENLTVVFSEEVELEYDIVL